jgi:hypothetical protein
MRAFTKIRTATDYICRHTSSDLTRHRALILLHQLRSCEAALATEGDIPPAVQGLLRDLVFTVRELTGTAWLTANRGDPDIAAFAALDLKPHPPSPADLDEILSRVLWARFATLHPQPGPPGRPRRAQTQTSPRAVKPSASGTRPTVNHDEFVAVVRERDERRLASQAAASSCSRSPSPSPRAAPRGPGLTTRQLPPSARCQPLPGRRARAPARSLIMTGW